MNITILTGAGISKESGIETFRNSKDSLWNNYNIKDVATIDAWKKDKELVLSFYNEMRNKLKDVKPNSAHIDLVKLEKEHNVNIITQNVDDLHERAGSTNVIHLHGELLKAKGTIYKSESIYCDSDIKIGDKCNKGSQLRPDVVWFGEVPYRIEESFKILTESDILIIIGTSFNITYLNNIIKTISDEYECSIICIDPNPSDFIKSLEGIDIIKTTATKGVKEIVESLL